VLLRERRARRLLSGLGVSSLGDGMSTVTIAWVGVRIAPAVNSACSSPVGRRLHPARRTRRWDSLASAQVWLATILGPATAGLLLVRIAPGWLLALDAASLAFLGGQAWRTHTAIPTTAQPVDEAAAGSGFRLPRRQDLLVHATIQGRSYPTRTAIPG
jgi:hypothetical protein